MDAKQKLQSLIERRRKKQTKLQKDGEHLNKIAEARNKFLKSQNITPNIYDQHDNYMTLIQKRFYELCKWPQLTPREFANVNILNGNSPKELYLIRKNDEAKAADFQRKLSTEYTKTEYDLVYCIKAGLICVAKSTKGWQRCRILKLHENSTTDALLFDIGLIERVSWHDLRIINEKLVNVKPMAIRCSLVNVITALPVERFSIQHHQHFLEILKEQHDFYIFVNRANFMSSDIFLYYKSDDQFHCVNNIFPANTLSDTDSSVDGEATSEAIVGNTSSSISKSKSNSLVKSEPEVPVQDQVRLEYVSDSIRTEHSACETEQSDESSPMEQREEMEQQQDMEQQPELLDQLLKTCKVSTPANVIVKHVAGFDEIYICFTKYAEMFNKLRFDVQTYVETKSPSGHNAWKIGDYCLAVDPAEGSGEWLRGKIVKMLAPESCAVFLRDIGKTIECECCSLKEISKELQSVRDFTWKVKLASIKMVKHCTTSMMNELICDAIESHEEMAISVVGDNNGNNLGVILWGINKICSALSAEHIEFVNINESLVKWGVAALTASFHGLTDVINPPQVNNADKTPETLDDANEIIERMHFSSFEESHILPLLKAQKNKMLSDKRIEVKHWLPSERVQAKKFVAFPMYVSQKLIIYVLEASRKTMSDEIKEILETKYRQKQLERKDSVEWKKEDACFARYDGDDRFYRATVRRVNYAKNTCVVRFIDFGNCETCSLDDLRKATMFGDIPVLTRQYQLYNIQSTAPDGIWFDHVRNFCTDLVVERHCDLTVIDNRRSSDTETIPEIEYCHLDLLTKHKDLATALVSRGYAKYINKPSSETLSPISH